MIKISKRIVQTLILVMTFTGCALADNVIAGTGPTGIASPTSTITFSEIGLANDTVLTNQYSSLGATFSGFFYNGCPVCVNAPPTGSKPDIGNFSNNNTSVFNTTESIFFNSAVNGAAFNFASNGGPFTFTASLGGSTVASFTNDGLQWGWYGFDNILFDRIDITGNNALLVDNIEMNATNTPEPGSLVLLGSGLMGLGGAIRRKLIA